LSPQPPAAGAWLAGDFHTHSLLTDGEREAGEVFAQGFGFGLDWMVNSEHGGAFSRTPQGQPWPADVVVLGTPPAATMWRWQSLWQFSYPLILKARGDYPGKLVLQGYEWNVPGHDHASVGIIETNTSDHGIDTTATRYPSTGKRLQGAPDARKRPASYTWVCEQGDDTADGVPCDRLQTDEDGGRAIARHEYLFDAQDSGHQADALLAVTGKQMTNDHAKALAGVSWLAATYPHSSYCLFNHPSRRGGYSIASLRDLNNAAPSVAFGFEGIPGHQRAGARGGYGGDTAADGQAMAQTTYGGADLMLAKVGGAWDALLGEGRRFFVFANSDFHRPQADFWPGEYAKNLTYVLDADRDGRYSQAELLDGLRAGNSLVVLGDLLQGLEVTAHGNGQAVGLGGTLSGGGDGLTLDIRFRSGGLNHNGDRVMIDHLDLIAGQVGGRIPKFLDDGRSKNPAYEGDSNATTKVIARFTAQDWRREGDGWYHLVYRLPEVRQGGYLRLRGTNLGLGVPGETDSDGNPLADALLAPNTEAKAYADLWFYSNPIFIDSPRNLGATE